MPTAFRDQKGNIFSLEEICDLCDRRYDYEIWVGSDSQVHRKKRKVKYITCIVLYRIGKGGRVFRNQEWQSLPPRDKTKNRNERKALSMALLKERLTKEVWHSVQTGFDLQPLVPKNAQLIVDVDLNKSPKYKSNDYFQELVGMVTGSGFRCRAKPDSWAAMCAADRYSK